MNARYRQLWCRAVWTRWHETWKLRTSQAR